MAHLIVFAKAPMPGRVKTRLARAVGDRAAARIATHMLDHTLAQVCGAGLGSGELCGAPDRDPVLARAAAEAGLAHTDQGEGDLGVRMHRAIARALKAHEEVLLIGTDCPALDAGRLGRAAARLKAGTTAVFYPTRDGGYCLVGLRRENRHLFTDIAWSTPRVMAATRERLKTLGWDWWEGEVLEDVDEPPQLSSLPAAWLAPG
ncbi:TIGR04282 family arsenosugar biosynthesis glycosyltransferase [Alkalilimnicola sp. S0819]|uniref:TIGR04282 family arsenosugar biosynthesis glycosyltransferase n=1 Tax=Alkalilimnicola sp. S0819 TaxID=2613922 RepID=UPI0012624103|nr:TIGR04282 family arsenosugar biosynthesis glycosyltransferase [Alkalilimnicola sp. S0819]KAB7627594.1 glycosyltransferase [Alkalilimnicola sp. S0819]MPQ15756.1 DUF2064 domain-containing protein [Alkalilimnicola sp. S0819]